MKRLNIVVEGQAEETFINEVLAQHLAQFNVGAVARRVEFSHKKKAIFRGGLVDYAKLRRDVVNWLNQDRAAFVTTMVDLYALPDDFPKRGEARKISSAQKKADFLEQAFAGDIGAKMFIPNIQLHEFETLLFVDIQGLRTYYPTHTKEIANLQAETARFKNPEEINEGKTTAPSKRILNHVPSYEKVIAGSLMAIDLGLTKIRPSCQHFDGWLTKLERLP
jgi:hypothetical protein